MILQKILNKIRILSLINLKISPLLTKKKRLTTQVQQRKTRTLILTIRSKQSRLLLNKS